MSDSNSILTPDQMATAAEDAAFAKATGGLLKSFLLGLTAGGYIALGFVFFTTSQVGAAELPYGVAKVIGGVVFSTGLALVVLTGAELFTSSTLTLTARASGRITWRQLLNNWVVVYLANFLGALTIVTLIFLGKTWENADGGWGAVVLNTSLHKVSHSFFEAFVLGVLCNLMVCLAVWAAYSGRTTTDKILAVTMPIALFVASGFEHSVANMFMIPLAILIKDNAGSDFWSMTGLEQSAFSELTWSAFYVDNLLPVTLGNIVGGGVMIGVLYWTIFHFLPSRRVKPQAD
ncbi:formate transporter FocA [Ornithinimicrobium cryptoxanthini]|uniref:Formate transporter FocA n=1 Tax=Ornithinimicrobium cryptoxanthini TaxID=2934161 RepID=A0ABY4YJF8_9MICO|nr:formate transporter FocA [Ornithinimicrobium cryptoxanthini]USQ76650.1 formate transporter FocA [Ornithinimicrobium cryptoxanthini]